MINMPYSEITWVWNGLPSGLGYTKFRFAGELNSTDLSTAAANSRTFLNTIAAYIKTGWTLVCNGAGTTHQTDGTLITDVALSPVPAQIAGTNNGNYAGGVGARVTWETGAVLLGKRIRGATYLVPLTDSAHDTDGTIGATLLTPLRTAATAFATSSPPLAVWSRRPGPVYAVTTVTGATVKDKSAIMRSRRD